MKTVYTYLGEVGYSSDDPHKTHTSLALHPNVDRWPPFLQGHTLWGRSHVFGDGDGPTVVREEGRLVHCRHTQHLHTQQNVQWNLR